MLHINNLSTIKDYKLQIQYKFTNNINHRISICNLFKQKNTIVLAATYFSRVKTQVSSALKSLTSVFGMGTGITSSLEPPERWCFFRQLTINNQLLTK